MERLHNGCLRILLSEQEVAQRRLDMMSLQNGQTDIQEGLKQLLNEARGRTGFVATGRLLVEAVPLDGGYLLLVTPQSTHRHLRIRRAVGPLVFTIANEDHLLALAQCWQRYPYRGRELCASSLYRGENGYLLVVYPAITFSKRTRRLFDTFALAKKQGHAAAAFVAEHAHPLVIGDALTKLGQAYDRSQA
jgi:hypothetical protein